MTLCFSGHSEIYDAVSFAYKSDTKHLAILRRIRAPYKQRADTYLGITPRRSSGQTTLIYQHVCLFIRSVIEMPKFTFVLVIVALAVSVQGFPAFEDDVATAAAAGDWDKVHEILRRHFSSAFGHTSMTDVRNLKPSSGGHVFAEALSSFEHSSNVNGQQSHESGGHKIVNKDGIVHEWDIKP